MSGFTFASEQTNALKHVSLSLVGNIDISGAFIYFFTAFFLSIMKFSIGYAQDLPQICSINNNEVWYFQIGSTNFEIKNPRKNFHGLIFNDVPTADNNAGPIGCAKNPQKLANIAFSGWPISDKQYGAHYPKEFGIIEIWKYKEHPGMSPELDVDISNRRLQLLDCTNKKFLTRFEDGTILCSNANDALNALSRTEQGKPPIESDFSYVFSENLYSTPLGAPFIANYFQSEMDISYLFKLDLGIHYEYIVPAEVNEISPSYIKMIDQSFRSTVEALGKSD